MAGLVTREAPYNPGPAKICPSVTLHSSSILEELLKTQTHCEITSIQDQGHRRPPIRSTGLDDAKLGQVAQFHVTKRLPGADHRRVSKTLHAWDVVVEPLLSSFGSLALELPGLLLLELGGSGLVAFC